MRGGGLVVVSRADLRYPHQLAARFQRDKAELRMHLDPAEAVNYVAPRGSELFGAGDVVALVEARL